METLLGKYPERKSGLMGGSKPPKIINPNLSQLPLPDSAAAKLLETKLYNKIEDNFHLANKKALLLNMRNYYEALGQDTF